MRRYKSIDLLILLLLLGYTYVDQVSGVEDSNITIAEFNSSTFVSRWNTSLTSSGSSSSDRVKLPLEQIGSYNFTVDWGDSISNAITKWNSAEIIHTYSSEGIYTIAIEGTLIGWRFDNGGDKLKIIEISQWGNINLGNSDSYFYGSANLELIATDALNLTGTTTLSRAFWGCTKLGNSGNMNNWDVSSVTNMYGIFSEATSFNQSIGDWDVHSVIRMRSMFAYASSFNQPIGNWDVSSVINMDSMFSNASSFNKPIGEWNVSSVTNMFFMFRRASSFNKSIINWDVSRVTSMEYMFLLASSFNQPIGNWDVSSVINMDSMFNGASSFNQSISDWNVSNVFDMGFMFRFASSFNQPICNWEVSRVTDMIAMFADASSFDQPIGDWDVSDVNRMEFMFSSASSFNQSLANWDVSSVIDMNNMFRHASSFNQPLGDWDVSRISSMKDMFDSVTLSVKNYDIILTDWAKLPLQTGVFFDGGNSLYSDTTARQYIIDTFDWTITDGGLADFAPPDINSPDDINYALGTTGNEIIWEVGDRNEGTYNVTKDGNLYISDNLWKNGTITINIDGLEIGEYTFIIYVYDSHGNMISDTVNVTVTAFVAVTDSELTGIDDDISDLLPIFMSLSILIIFIAVSLIQRLRKKRSDT